MSDKEILDFSERLNRGLRLAERRMLEDKALHNKDIVVCSDDGVIRRVPAIQVMASL